MYDKQNIFAKILRSEIPSTKIYEDEFVYAFNDIAPVAPIHVLVIPKGEFISFSDFINKAPNEFVANFYKSLQKVIDKLDLVEEGYRLITNHGENGGQIVPHFHIHIIGGKKLGAKLKA